MSAPTAQPITDPDFALLEILGDPTYPPTWCVFDGVVNSLAKWIEEVEDDPEASRALAQMLSNGLSPLTPLRDGATTPLHLAANLGRENLVKVLTSSLRQNATTGLVDQPTGGQGRGAGRTALWEACDGGLSLGVVDRLLSAGADPTVQRDGHGLLWLVCSWPAHPDRLAILQRLLGTAACERINQVSQDSFGESTALHKAIAHDNIDAIRMLVAAGADRTQRRQGKDAEALVEERANDNPDMAQLLHEWRVTRERTELHRALGEEDARVVRPARRL